MAILDISLSNGSCSIKRASKAQHLNIFTSLAAIGLTRVLQGCTPASCNSRDCKNKKRKKVNVVKIQQLSYGI